MASTEKTTTRTISVYRLGCEPEWPAPSLDYAIQKSALFVRDNQGWVVGDSENLPLINAGHAASSDSLFQVAISNEKMANILLDIEASQHDAFRKAMNGPRGSYDYYNHVWLYRLIRCVQRDIATLLAEKLNLPKDSPELRKSSALRWSSKLECLKPLLERIEKCQVANNPALITSDRFNAITGPYLNGTATPQSRTEQPHNASQENTPVPQHPLPVPTTSSPTPPRPLTGFSEAPIAHPSPTLSRASTVAAFQLRPFAAPNAPPTAAQFLAQREQAKRDRLKADQEENEVRESYQAAMLEARHKEVEEALQREKALKEQVMRDNSLVLEERIQRDKQCREVEERLVVIFTRVEESAREIKELEAEIEAAERRQAKRRERIKRIRISGKCGRDRHF